MLLEKYFPGFEKKFIDVDGAEIHSVIGGTGNEAILFLHGHPENYLIWRFIAPKLSEKYTVVLTDLRGYGESSKPEGLDDHSNYSKRVMARDQVQVMQKLGFEKFHVVSHDRGSRVAHRLVLDNLDKVTTVTYMDILPTDDMYDSTNMAFAEKYYHWFLYIQPKPLPEKFLGADPKFFIDFNLRKKIGPTAKPNFPEEIMREYTRHFANPEVIHGICEDYRASYTIDRVHNDEDRDKVIEIPTLAIWGANGIVGKTWDVLAGWQKTCSNVEGLAVENCGHFVPEEQPEIVLEALENFLQRNSL